MSWGAIMLNLPKGAKLEALPNDFQVAPIGNSEDIYAVLRELLPQQEHRLGQTSYCDETCYVELNYKKEGVIDSIGVRSNAGQNALAVMKAVCEAMDLTLIDYQSGEIADFDEITQEGMDTYHQWSNRVLQP